MIQAWLLYIIYGIYMGETAQFEAAQTMFHSAVSASLSIPFPREQSTDINQGGPPNGSSAADDRNKLSDVSSHGWFSS